MLRFTLSIPIEMSKRFRCVLINGTICILSIYYTWTKTVTTKYRGIQFHINISINQKWVINVITSKDVKLCLILTSCFSIAESSDIFSKARLIVLMCLWLKMACKGLKLKISLIQTSRRKSWPNWGFLRWNGGARKL